jgi:hypothetical protein
MESHKAVFPPLPHSLEIPSGLPHSHGLDVHGVEKKTPVTRKDYFPIKVDISDAIQEKGAPQDHLLSEPHLP